MNEFVKNSTKLIEGNYYVIEDIQNNIIVGKFCKNYNDYYEFSMGSSESYPRQCSVIIKKYLDITHLIK